MSGKVQWTKPHRPHDWRKASLRNPGTQRRTLVGILRELIGTDMRLIVDEYTDCTRGERRPTLFYEMDTGERLLLLADASETAFSHCYQPLIDVVKTSFIDSLIHRAGSLQERMRSAFHATQKTMRERYPSSTEFGEESYTAVFVALGIEDSMAFPFWIGSPQAKLLRGGAVIKTTSPHVTAIPNSNLIVTINSISTDSEKNVSVAADDPWSLTLKDTLLLADHRLFSLFSENDLANLIEGTSSNKAKALVEAAQALDFSFAQSAIVAQLQ
jgi:hypothetical protein